MSRRALGLLLALAMTVAVVAAWDDEGPVPAPCASRYDLSLHVYQYDTIANVGRVEIGWRAPHINVGAVSLSRARFQSGGGISEPIIAPDFSQWLAEGTWMGSCWRASFLTWVRVINRTFDGSVWRTAAPPGGDESCPGGSGSGGGFNQQTECIATSGGAAVGGGGYWDHMCFDAEITYEDGSTEYVTDWWCGWVYVNES